MTSSGLKKTICLVASSEITCVDITHENGSVFTSKTNVNVSNDQIKNVVLFIRNVYITNHSKSTCLLCKLKRFRERFEVREHLK